MIKVILWDIDGTLLDFGRAETYAMKKCFEILGLGVCTDEMVSRYAVINKKYWEQLERGQITKAQTLTGRFVEFFEKEGLPAGQADAFNREYQMRLGDQVFFNDNGKALVTSLRPMVKQYAVTNGTLTAQRKKLARSGLDKLLDGVFISDEIGKEKPDIAFFEHTFKHLSASQQKVRKDEIMIVGDSLTSDMQGGNNAGILCCWYDPAGQACPAGLRIDYQIRDLWQVADIVRQTA